MPIENDAFVAEIVLREGLVDTGALRRALEIQWAAATLGMDENLLDILRTKGILSERDALALEDELTLSADSRIRGSENLEDPRVEDVAADNRQIAGLFPELRFLHQVADPENALAHRLACDHPVARDSLARQAMRQRHLLQPTARGPGQAEASRPPVARKSGRPDASSPCAWNCR